MFSDVLRRLLLLPVGPATVERSTLNRILTDTRCRLTANDMRHLMMMSVEGPHIPDVRDATAQEEDMNELISDVNSCLYHLLPAQRDARITNSLRMAKKYPVPFAKSTRFQKSFIPYALANFQ